MKIKFLILILLLQSSCVSQPTPPKCSSEACYKTNCSYQAGYKWAMKGASAYSFCPFQFSQEYQKGYEAGVRQHQIELKYQSQLLKKEIRPQ